MSQRYTKFEVECLTEHNRYRALHGVPPLQLDPSICKYATEWAQRLLALNKMEHRTDRIYGENIYMAMGKEVTGSVPVDCWYSEIKDYSFQKAEFSPYTGHFTQLVWKNSTHLGVGVASKDKITYVVCNYNPPGNVRSSFRENVFPPRK